MKSIVSPKTPIKILIIDDDRVDRATLKRDLRYSDIPYEISEADSAQKGIEEFIKQEFDCVFLDFYLPDKDGLDVLRELIRYGGPQTLVIGITGNKKNKAENMLKAGACDYLIKEEVNSKMVERALRYAFNRKEFQETAEYKFQQLFDNSNDGIIILNNQGSILEANTKAQQMWGYTRAEFLQLNISHLYIRNTFKKRDFLKEFSLLQKQENITGFSFESECAKKNGAVFYAEIAAKGLILENKELILGVVRDITQRKSMEKKILQTQQRLERSNKKLDQLAHQDPLTKLLNRRGMEQSLKRIISSANRNQQEIFAILIDLDNFKRINDTFGYTAGDVILRETAKVIDESLRPFDHAARIGGDEFLLLVATKGLEEIKKIAERLRIALKRIKIEHPTGTLEITGSVGVAQINLEAITLEEILSQSQNAIHRSKSQGKDTVTISKMEMETLAGNEKNIAKVIQEGQGFRVVKQAIYAITTENIVAYEFLSRGPKGILENPNDFFHISLENNALVDCRCFKDCIAASEKLDGNFRFHINLFPQTLAGLAPSYFVELLSKTHKRNLFCIEICEKQLVGDPSYLKEHIKALKDAGIKIALDNLGFGRSSLESLIFLEPDIVKINKKRIIGINDDKEKKNELKKLIKIANAIDAKVIATCIENKEDLQALIDLKIEYGQGFFWGKPS